MLKKIFKIIFSFIFFIDLLFVKFFKKSFLALFKDLYEEKSYTSIRILNKKITFFTPNQISRWRVNTFYTKERETLHWIDNFIDQENNVFWDIGSNIGLYSIYASVVHKKISVVSFEPSTSNLRILSRNISINKYQDRIKIFQLPLSDQENKYQLMNESEFIEGFSQNTFGKSIDFKGSNFIPKNTYNIIGTSINHLLKNDILNFPNYIKIDVDGIEHIILRGASEFLSDKRLKSVLVELNEDYKDQFNEVKKLMENSNFKFRLKKEIKFEINKIKYKLFNYIFDKNEY